MGRGRQLLGRAALTCFGHLACQGSEIELMPGLCLRFLQTSLFRKAPDPRPKQAVLTGVPSPQGLSEPGGEGAAPAVL